MIETKAFMSKENWDVLVKASQLFECKTCGEKLDGYKAVMEHAKKGHHSYKQQGMGKRMSLNVG